MIAQTAPASTVPLRDQLRLSISLNRATALLRGVAAPGALPNPAGALRALIILALAGADPDLTVGDLLALLMTE